MKKINHATQVHNAVTLYRLDSTKNITEWVTQFESVYHSPQYKIKHIKPSFILVLNVALLFDEDDADCVVQTVTKSIETVKSKPISSSIGIPLEKIRAGNWVSVNFEEYGVLPLHKPQLALITHFQYNIRLRSQTMIDNQEVEVMSYPSYRKRTVKVINITAVHGQGLQPPLVLGVDDE